MALPWSPPTLRGFHELFFIPICANMRILRTAFFNFRNIPKVLSQSDAERQIHAFITSRLSYYYYQVVVKTP